MVWIQDDIMAEEQPHQSQLFMELKKRFPEVPDNVVSFLMHGNNFVRERCIDALGRESNKYLYSSPDNNIGLENLHITAERQLSSNSAAGVDVLCKRSDSSDSRLGLGNASVSGLSNTGRNNAQPNNGLGSANTTPSSDIDVQALYGSAMYGQGGSGSQNGPYTPRPMPYNSHTTEAQSGGWVYSPQPYPPGTGNSGRSQGPYTSQSQAQQSVTTPIPQGHYTDFHPGWPYERHDPRHQTPQSTQRFPISGQGIRTPSPQHYPPLYQFDYPYNQTGSPNTGRPVMYGPPGSGMELPPRVSQSYPSSLSYMPVTQTSTALAAGGRDVSPSASTAMWYPNATTQGAGSNTGTPTHGYSVYGQAWRHALPGTPDSEQGHILPPGPMSLNMNGPLDARRGSEDLGYTQSLLLHQKARMEKLRHDLESGYLSLKMLVDEVSAMEKSALERKNQRSSTFPTGEDVGKMRDENRRLLIDIQLMTREIDVVNNGQTPLGVLDPQEQNFYKNIGSTGQRGSIHAGGDDGSERNYQAPSQVGNRVPPARPPPPPPATTTSSGTPGAGGRGPGTTSPSPPDPEEAPNWSCSACTFLNHPLLDRCEFCEMPRLNPPTGAYR